MYVIEIKSVSLLVHLLDEYCLCRNACCGNLLVVKHYWNVLLRKFSLLHYLRIIDQQEW